MPKISSMGLGKSTLRGVKKCPNCGTLNGTRGLNCKNKLCNKAFKETSGKKKGSSEACRLDTGTSTRVYSVRVRDKGPDYRGFVQLPAVQPPFPEISGLIESTTLCFVDNCEGNFNAKVLQCHEPLGVEKTVKLCKHINGALRCTTDALELPVNSTVLDALSIEETCKQEIRRLMTESSGPTVQRVSRNVIAVKCRVSPKSPLGYLHVSFASWKSAQDIQFSCPCSTFKESARVKPLDGRCPHFYACICAFVNQEALREEFYNYIRLEVALDFPVSDDGNFCEQNEQVEGALNSLWDGKECHLTVLQDDVSNILSENMTEDVSSILSQTITEDAIVFSTVDDLDAQSIDALKQVNLDEEENFNSPLEVSDGEGKELSAINGLDFVSSSSVDLLSSDLQAGPSFHQDLENPQLIPLFLETVIEQTTSRPPVKKNRGAGRPKLGFLEWLGSITESINQYMHYQFPGKPNCLVFQTHKKFFEMLKARIYRARRKRATNRLTIFTRADMRPVGTFTKYSWTLGSRMHVKAVFDTPQLPLHLVRSFIRKDDGTFEPANADNTTGNPLLYKTYLRVGEHRGESEPAAFTIEWTPNILPISQTGELCIHFEFGHVP